MTVRTTIARAAVLAIAVATPAFVAGSADAATSTYSAPTPVSIGQGATSAGGATVTVTGGSKATPYPSTASVADIVGGITDVNLTLLGVTHTDPDELDVMLVSPGGKRAVVMSDAGGSHALTGTDITLDDQATQDLPDSATISTGSYRPANYEAGDTFATPAPDASGAGSSLSVFNDSTAAGTWQLYVMSDGAAGGSISGWRLDVKTTGTQPYPSGLTVSGAGTITDVDVVLDGFSHTSPADVDVLLVGPGGQQATVLSDAGSDADVAGATVVLDDEATTQVGTPLTGGRYQPTNLGGADAFPAPAPTATGTSALSVFDGTDANGTWQLYVTDDSAGDSGALTAGWSLQITTTDTTAPTVVTTKPTAGKRHVARGADVVVTFSERLRRSTVNGDTVYLVRKGTTTHVRARLRYDAVTSRVTLDPRSRLRAHTTYQLVVTTRVKDVTGNRLDQSATQPFRQGMTSRFTTR